MEYPRGYEERREIPRRHESPAEVGECGQEVELLVIISSVPWGRKGASSVLVSTLPRRFCVWHTRDATQVAPG